MAEHSAQTQISAALESSLENARVALSQEQLRLLVAVSGGRDSVALLDALDSLRRKLGLELVVAHINHGLRPSADDEAVFVTRLADAYGLCAEVARAPQRLQSENIEAWARRVRYTLLEQIRAARAADLVVTAHHMNDQAETLMFRALTGRLASSTASIQQLSVKRRLLRPLLGIRRKTIDEYLHARSLSCVEDESNADSRRSRNFLRHEILPALQAAFGERVTDNLALSAGRLNEDEELLSHLAEDAMLKLGSAPTLQQLQLLPRPLGWRVLRLLASRSVGEAGATLGYAALAQLFTLSPSLEKRRLDLGRGVAVVINGGGRLSFVKGEAPRAGFSLSPEALGIPSTVFRAYKDCVTEVRARLIPSGELTLEEIIERSRQGSAEATAAAYFDADQLDYALLSVRERRDGDSLVVWRRGRRKLKKLLQEKRLVLTLRDRIPIVEYGKNVLWVPGVARSDIAPVSEKTASILELLYVRRGFPS